MATRSTTVHPGVGPATIKIRSAAGFGILLLVIGLAAGAFIGNGLRQSDDPRVAAESSEVARQAGTATTLGLRDDYGIRHSGEFAASTATTLGLRDDYGIRHSGEFAASTTTTLGLRDDYGIRHSGEFAASTTTTLGPQHDHAIRHS
jgi:hypothetical protein